MTTNDTYNGWTNYETWNVNLWLTNESALYEGSREVCTNAADRAEMKYRQGEAGEALKAYFEEVYASQLPETGPCADLLNAALSRVNWYEIAGHMLED